MFEINLLAKPGLQEISPELEAEGIGIREAAIISRLEARLPEGELEKAPARKRLRTKSWIWLFIFIIIIGLAGYWWYQGWDWKPWKGLLPSRMTPEAIETLAAAPYPGTCPRTLAWFLEKLPGDASLDFLEIGAGILMFRVQGEDLGPTLLQIQTEVEGYQYSDLLRPRESDYLPGYWLGTVAFKSLDQVGALRPVKAEYDRFFLQLEHQVRDTGGMVVSTIPGTMTAGEYVIQGMLHEIQAHLANAAAKGQNIHYHRIGLLRDQGKSADFYFLRVIFNIIEERPLSLPLSSPGDTGV
ncbi:MAG: hypothetical protein JSU61_07965 [Fidelibacterota bacterium]|nr:MAG: hypothetical protein JSU61_07965 [Candidatus Neomarinimicrobiota bacterium]